MLGEVLRQIFAQECGAAAGAGKLFIGQGVAMQLHNLDDRHAVLGWDGVGRLPHRDPVLRGAVVLHHVRRDQALIGAFPQDRGYRGINAAAVALVEAAICLFEVGGRYSVVAILGNAADRPFGAAAHAAIAHRHHGSGNERLLATIGAGNRQRWIDHRIARAIAMMG
ncbi:hypothetical protein D3C77_434350 [compost metagenome]